MEVLLKFGGVERTLIQEHTDVQNLDLRKLGVTNELNGISVIEALQKLSDGVVTGG